MSVTSYGPEKKPTQQVAESVTVYTVFYKRYKKLVLDNKVYLLSIMCSPCSFCFLGFFLEGGVPGAKACMCWTAWGDRFGPPPPISSQHFNHQNACVWSNSYEREGI